MCRPALCALAVFAAVSVLAAPAVLVATPGDGFRWTVDGFACGSSNQWLQVRDLAAGEGFVPVPASLKGGKFSGTQSGLRFSGDWRPAPGGAVLHCAVAAEPARDRALIVRVSLPLNAVGWTWWDDALDRRTIEAGKSYTRVADWSGLRKVSVYPLCTVSGPETGICLATPLDEPRIFRLSYSAERQALEAEFDLGLSPDAVKLGAKADFRLYVYPVSPQGGFRAGLQQYYRLFPRYAKRRVEAAGIWLLGFRPETMACPWDWGFKFDEGAQHHALYDQEHDILSFVYTEPAGKYENFGPVPSRSGKPEYGEKAPPLTPEQLKQSVLGDLQAPEGQRDRHFGAPRRLIAQADANSAIENHDGSWVWRHWTDEWSSDGSYLSNLTLNPDPDLPRPNRASVTWEVELDPAFAVARQQGAELSGVYLDSVCGFTGFYNENFRREHWRYADVPLTISYQYKQPVQLHSFSFWELSAPMADTLWEQGKYLIANTGRPEMMHFTPRLDMISASEGNRCGLAADEHYRYLRALSAGKVISWMDYSFVKPQVPWEEKERGMQRCLFYAVHPGTGSFEDPVNYEPSRPLFRRYEPLITWLDQAGWQPLTLAEATAPEVLLERYGPGSGSLAEVSFVAVRNPGKSALTPAVRIAQEALPPSCRGEKTRNCLAWLLVSNRPAPTQWVSSKVGDLAPVLAASGQERSLLNVMRVPVAADSTEVIALGTREALAGLWLRQAADWLQRAEREAAWLGRGGSTLPLNGGFEKGLAPWGTDGQSGRRATVTVQTTAPLAGKASLRAVSEGVDAFQSLHQSLSLLPGETYTLRFTYSWSRPEGAAGIVYPRFGVKGPDGNWVSSKYLYFRELQPTGGKPVRFEKQFTVPEGHSAGFFQFMFERDWGTVEIDEVTITSPGQQAGRQALADLQEGAREGGRELRKQLGGKSPDLPALAAAQRPLYEKLRMLAAALPEGHPRRCLALPVADFAEALGQATQVATGYTLGLVSGGRVASGGLGTIAALPLELTAGKRGPVAYACSIAGAEGLPATPPGTEAAGVRVRLPEREAFGWTDVPVDCTFTLDGRRLWLPARFTLRLQPAVSVEAPGVLSAVCEGLALRLRSWLAQEAPPKLQARLQVGERAFELAPTALSRALAAPEVAVPLPPGLADELDGLACRQQPLKLRWEAGALSGETPVALVRGTRCPVLAAPVLDGTLAPGEWRGAAEVSGFVTPADGKAAARPTTVLLGHDADNLYLAFRCEGQAQLAAPSRPRDGALWEDDAVEVFLQPPGSEAYYHLGVNAAGALLDGRCDPGETTAWNGTWRAAAGRLNGGYVVEAAVPFATLGAAPTGLWRANFGREEADTKVPTCWNPTGGGFHVPGRFGQLRIE